MQRRFALSLLVALYCAGSGNSWFAEPAEARNVWRLDFGTDDSPVADGFIRVSPSADYKAHIGFGWADTRCLAYDVPPPPANPSYLTRPGGQVIPDEMLLQSVHSDLNRDGVESREDLVFRVDVPDGIYRVAITLGHLQKAICSEQIVINGQLVAKDVDAKHYARRGGPDHVYGYPRTVRRTVQSEDGVLQIRIHGDDTGFMDRFAREYDKPVRYSYLVGKPGRTEKPPTQDVRQWGAADRRNRSSNRRGGDIWVHEDIGGPFTENALLAIEVYPFVEQPLAWKNDQLVTTVNDRRLRKAVDLFNDGRFAEAEKAFDQIADDYHRALGYLWLAGRPEHEQELKLVPKSLAILERLASERSGDLTFAETLEHARRMNKALHRFVHRADDGRTYNELLMVTGEVSSMQPEDPAYYKSRIYAARSMYMVDPHRWVFVSETGQRIFERLRSAGFGDNRFVRWYLDNQWSNEWPDWPFPDYDADVGEAPRWAAEVYEAYNRELDLCKWWIDHRQEDDGSLGGGWGDDVEILRSFGSFGGVNPEASSRVVDGVRKLANGAWNSGGIDTERGYFAGVADSEHTGEWTGDTLTAMIRTDYGNPVYLERAMKTAKLMRDLWMARNQRGDYLMKSNFLGARGVGGEGTHNDSRINYRPASPAAAVLWYNNSPTIRQLFLDWADSWLRAAMSTEKDKPRGIIPQEIGFAESELGGTGAPTWYQATHPPGTVNFDWGGAGKYHDYIVELLIGAHRATGDARYLEPMELEAVFAVKHCPEEIRNSKLVAEGRLIADLWADLQPGTAAWMGAKLATWPDDWDKIRRVLLPERYRDGADVRTLSEVADLAAQERQGAADRWPHVTTECIATDRVYWMGMGNTMRLMTGYDIMGDKPLVTYRGLGRWFAAAVLKADTNGLRVVIYNMSDDPKQASLQPWLLDVGPAYRLAVGPDADEDGRMDQVTHKQTVTIRARGQEIPFRLPARSAIVVELARSNGGQTKSTQSGMLYPDVALSNEDICLGDHGKTLEVTVHNVGSAAAQDIVVAISDGRSEIARQTIAELAAPLDLEPKTATVRFPRAPDRQWKQIQVILDPEETMEETTRVNNQITWPAANN